MTSWSSCVCAPHPRLGLTPPRRDRPGGVRPPGAAAPSPSSATSTTATRTSTSTPSPSSSSRSTSSTAWAAVRTSWRFAALMHDVGKPRTRRFEPGGVVTFHHHDVVGAKLTRKRMKALRFSNHDIEAVSRLVRAPPALPRLRLGGVDRQRRTPLRPRRRRRARAPAHPHPRRLHHPQPAQGRPAAPHLRRPRGADRPAVARRRSSPPSGPT